MPGGKARLKNLLTGGLVVGSASTDTHLKAILAGSVSITGPAFDGNDAGSTEVVEATIAALTASHTFICKLEDISPCMALIAACAGAGKASLVFGYTAGSGGGAAAAKAGNLNYIAVRT